MHIWEAVKKKKKCVLLQHADDTALYLHFQLLIKEDYIALFLGKWQHTNAIWLNIKIALGQLASETTGE